MVDKEAPVTIVLGDQTHLPEVASQWVKVEAKGSETIDGVACTIVGGPWHEVNDEPAKGTYRMWIAADHSLKKYEVVRVLADKNSRPVNLTITWAVTSEVNGTVDESKFVIPNK
jgi:hypothetical protein